MQGSPSRPSIYLVDDDEQILTVLKVVLMRRYNVTVNKDPALAVEEIRTMRPDVVILDIKMPERDGFWVLREIRKFNQETRVIFNSGYQEVARSADVDSIYGAFAYLNKGCDMEYFLETVARAAETRIKQSLVG